MNEFVIKDKFTDYNHKEHQFVIAAVKSPLKENGITIYTLQIGVAICNPIDKFDEELGRIKAIGRAYKSEASIIVAHSSQLTEHIIKEFMLQECDYIKQHPEKYISGYKELKAKYYNQLAIEEMENNFTDIEKVIIEGIKKDPHYLDNINMYLDLCKK